MIAIGVRNGNRVCQSLQDTAEVVGGMGFGPYRPANVSHRHIPRPENLIGSIVSEGFGKGYREIMGYRRGVQRICVVLISGLDKTAWRSVDSKLQPSGQHSPVDIYSCPPENRT